jgi:hypothetical protein
MPEFLFQIRGTDLTDISTRTRDLLDLRDNDLENELRISMPVGGMIRWHTGVDLPDGWLSCDGSSKDTVTYSALFSVIGYTYGGSGSSFTLPTVTNFIIRY